MTSWNLSFDPLMNIHLIIWGLVLLFIFIGALEWRRKLGRRLLRMISLTVAFIGLAGILLRPHYRSETKLSGAMILTNNYSPVRADSLLRQYPALSVYKTSESASFVGAVELRSFHTLKEIPESIDFVLGDGFPSYVFEETDDLRYSYLPSEPAHGIQAIKMPGKVSANRPNILSGQAHALEQDSWIKWSGPEGVIDSLRLVAGEQGFSFSFTPKVSGKLVYELGLEDSAGILRNRYHVPVVVAEERKLSILFVAQFPTFESRDLKNLLAEQGHALSMRYQLSKGKFRYEYANQAEFPFSRLTSAVLNEADLLFIDQASLEALGTQERNVLNKAVENGLGILIGLSEVPVSKAIKNWIPFDLKEYKQDTIAVALAPDKIAILNGSGRVFQPSAELNTVWKDSQSNSIAAWGYSGLGKIGSALWQNSYRLMLKGEELVYVHLWIELIEAVARKSSALHSVEWQSKAPYYVDQPIELAIISASPVAPEVWCKNGLVPLKEDWQIENVWRGTIWPSASGWDSLLVGENADVENFFVHDQPDWQTIATSQQVAITALYAAGTPDNASVARTQMIKRPLPPAIFYLLLLLGFGGLWLAPKL